jgi:prevent-host-death family protein
LTSILLKCTFEQMKKPVDKVSTVWARNNFSDIINRAAFGKEQVVLTRRGKDICAVVPMEDVDNLQETVGKSTPVPVETPRVKEHAAVTPRGKAPVDKSKRDKPLKEKTGAKIHRKRRYPLTEKKEEVLKRALWDYRISPEEFLDILEGKSTRDWPDRGMCAARLLENVNWLDIVKVIPPKKICALWEEAREYVRESSLREGMDFACGLLFKKDLSPPG